MFAVENKRGLHVLKLLEAVQILNVTAVHHRGHQKGDAEIIKRNSKVDITAKRVALDPVTWHLSLKFKARYVQLFLNLHKRRFRQSPRMGLQERSGRP